jgi:adenosine deaminase
MKIKGILMDTHCHLDGSLSIKTVQQLAEMQNIVLPKNFKTMLSVSENCADLNEYLSKFAFPLSLLQTAEAIEIAVKNLCEEFKEKSLIYAEIRFAPQLHTQKHLSQEDVVKAALKGLKSTSFNANLILSCMRSDNNKEENLETVHIAHKYLGQGICAVDLAGAEGLYPTKTFSYLFNEINRLNIPFTVHCGEAAGPESIQAVLPYNPKRIGHGVRCLENEDVVKEIIEKGIVLELCPTSNMNTKIFNKIESYPIKTLIEKGVKVSINTDNTTVSNTDIEEEFIKVISTFGLKRKDIRNICINTVESLFLNQTQKDRLYQKVCTFKF